MRKLERHRFFENHDIDALAKQGAQQRLARRYAALGRCDRDHNQRFEPDEQEHATGIGVRSLRCT